MKKTETLAVLAHRARARADLPRPVPMGDVLAMAGASPQWWSRMIRGEIAEPSAALMRYLAKALKVSQAALRAAHAETRRRKLADLEV